MLPRDLKGIRRGWATAIGVCSKAALFPARLRFAVKQGLDLCRATGQLNGI
jgi:hypothetical protein